MNKKTVNIRNLAQRLNVTPGTVSRALNRVPGVSDEVRENILQLADELGYRPKPFRTKRTNTIGLLVGTNRSGVIENEFLDIVVNEVARALSQRGLFLHLDYSCRTERAAVLPPMAATNRVDGIILAGFPPEPLCKLLKTERIPAVVLHDSAARTGLVTVQHNNFQAMKSLMEKLLDGGFRRIGLLLTDRKYTTIDHRYRGMLAAFDSRAVKFPAELCHEGLADNLTGGRAGILRILEQGELPEVIACANDCMAIGALMELNRRGIRVPEDVRLVGCGNYRQSAETFPPLTTVDTPWQATVEVALDQLEAQIRANGELPPYPSEFIVDAGVIWRESCPLPEPIYKEATK